MTEDSRRVEGGRVVTTSLPSTSLRSGDSPPPERIRLTIGIPCYDHVAPETLSDYMRFAYYVGRRMPEVDFFLAVKSKSEQFRARNSIVENALKVDSHYILMLDDDQIIDWEDVFHPTERYNFLQILLDHMRVSPDIGIVGALYYQRGGQFRPVVMKQSKEGYYWMRDDEIDRTVQEVAVVGGGCMLLNANIFSRIPHPWFEAEVLYGTDIQICKKAADAGFKILCDTGIELGHVLSRREIVTSRNRHRLYAESNCNAAPMAGGINRFWSTQSALNLYLLDAQEYLGVTTVPEIEALADEYRAHWHKYPEYADKAQYYRDAGRPQLARQVAFHLTDGMIQQFDTVLNLLDHSHPGRGLDFGCGSSPIGMELALKGHHMDFVDIEGAYAYEFTKWRAKHRGIGDRCGWELAGPYDFVLAMDIIEHLQPDKWRDTLDDVTSRIKQNGCLLTNYFVNRDYDNAEHCNLDQQLVRNHLVSRGVYPLNEAVWMKRDLTLGGTI